MHSNTLQNNIQSSPSFFHLLAIYFIIPLSHPQLGVCTPSGWTEVVLGGVCLYDTVCIVGDKCSDSVKGSSSDVVGLGA